MRERPYEFALLFQPRFVERLRSFPREPNIIVRQLRALVAIGLRVWLKAYHRFAIVGQENLRTNRPLVMVANHSSHLDALCLLAALPLRRLHQAFPAAAEDYFFRSVARTWIAAVIVNALPFARGRQARQSLGHCKALLEKAGNILIIFPEGTRSRNGRVQEFKSGIGALVAGRDVLVVPCFVEGAFRAWAKGTRFPRPGKVRLIIGEGRNYAAHGSGKDEIFAIALELETAVRELQERNGVH